MAKLSWGDPTKRIGHYGVENVAVYIGGVGYAWDGVTSVDFSTGESLGQTTYLDGVPKNFRRITIDNSLSISSYTKPRFLDKALGGVRLGAISFGNQFRSLMGLSWVTRYTSASGKTFRIFHIVYNIRLSFSGDNSSTNNPSQNFKNCRFDGKLLGGSIGSYQNIGEVTIDESDLTPEQLLALEEWLYGTANSNPRLPSISDMTTILTDSAKMEVTTEVSDGLYLISSDGNDVVGNLTTGLYKIETGQFNEPSNGLYLKK